MREIPKKNYLFLVLLFVITVIVVIYMVDWYKKSQEYHTEVSIMSNFLGEIKETEIDNYILENPEIVIYISYGSKKEYGKFEKKLKDYILKEDIKNHFIYVNCENVSIDFILNFQKKYFNESIVNKLLSYPNLLFVEDGKVMEILYEEIQKPDMKDVKEFLEKIGVTKDA